MLDQAIQNMCICSTYCEHETATKLGMITEQIKIV